MDRDAKCDLAREEFILLYVVERDRGVLRTEAEYLLLYPGCEAAISEEWARLGGSGRRGAGPTAPGHASRPDRPWKLGNYRIEREIGRGAQSTVFLAWDEALGRQVAVKVLKASWSGSEELVRRFQIEARALARLDHEGLATIYDAGSSHGLEWLAMRYVDGHTLASETGAGPPDGAGIARYLTLLEKAARALHAAHERGMVHRDVKPANIMVTSGGEPVVLDFGLVRLLGIEGPALTATGDLLGTPAFMAPEQIAGDPARIDRRADVYALGATLDELVAGRSGGTGAGARPDRLRPKASRRNRSVSRDLDAVLATALDPDPDRRYATAAAFADDLARVRLGQAVSVRLPGPIPRFGRWCRRAPAAAALIIVPPLALGAGLAGLAVKNSEIGDAARDSELKAIEAGAARAEALDRFKDFQRLDDLRRIDDLIERDEDLWPPRPDGIPAMERWLDDARVLVTRLPEHRAALAALRQRGTPGLEREEGVDPVVDRLRHVERVSAAARQELAAPGATDSRRAGLKATVNEAALLLPELRREAESRPRFRYPAPEDQWLNDNLAKLVAGLEILSSPSLHAATIASVERRVAVARALVEKSLTGPAAAWKEAVEAIANPVTDPAYRGLRIEPVLGLVPIGRDPRSKLWEFAHLLSGEPPVRDAGGTLVLTPETSIVLVLLPGGTCRMGARRPVYDDELFRDHVDSQARDAEGPVHEVSLDPFMISKYEMTQGQWLRATGTNPSHANPDRLWDHGYRPTLRHPVEQVSFFDCEETLRRLGLVVPTEAQWEHAARGNTTTPWWPGPTIDSFLNDENLADRTYVETEQLVVLHDAERRDGWSGSAPVGSYRANPFGLHDVIGNVTEWCRDRMSFYRNPALPGDGLRDDPRPDEPRALRGGGYSMTADASRSAARIGQPGSARNGVVGVRPALLLRAP